MLVLGYPNRQDHLWFYFYITYNLVEAWVFSSTEELFQLSHHPRVHATHLLALFCKQTNFPIHQFFNVTILV